MSAANPNRIGLVAGWGDFPVQIAQRLVESGREVYCIGVANHASERLAEICQGFKVFGIGQLGAQAQFLRRHDVTQATMAGKIFKTRLLTRFAWIRHRPDWTCWRYFYRQFLTGTEDRRDDTMLLTITRLFEDKGIVFLPATNFAPELLVKEGVLTHRAPNIYERNDIAFGWQLAKSMGGLDIGQSVAVKGRACLAVEAIEGTDECIRRAGGLCEAGNFTIVKVAKPKQDTRFDMPTIGLGTIESMIKSGARVLAIEADMTIVLDQEQVVAQANQHGLTIVAIKSKPHAQTD